MTYTEIFNELLNNLSGRTARNEKLERIEQLFIRVNKIEFTGVEVRVGGKQDDKE